MSSERRGAARVQLESQRVAAHLQFVDGGVLWEQLQAAALDLDPEGLKALVITRLITQRRENGALALSLEELAALRAMRVVLVEPGGRTGAESNGGDDVGSVEGAVRAPMFGVGRQDQDQQFWRDVYAPWALGEISRDEFVERYLSLYPEMEHDPWIAQVVRARVEKDEGG